MFKRPSVQWMGIIVVGVALRLALAAQNHSLWLDEAYSVQQAARPLVEIVVTRPDTAHPPLYYVLLHYWQQVFGDGETAVRLLSILFSTLNISLVYLLTRRLVRDQAAALTAAALLALSPLDIWYAAEARMYALVGTLGLLMGLGLMWPGWRGKGLYLLALVALLYVSYTAVPLWIVVSAGWLIWWWQNGRQPGELAGWLLATAAACLAYLPWLPEFLKLFTRLNRITLFAQIYQRLGSDGLTPAQYLLGIPLAAAGCLLLFMLLVRLWQQPVVRRSLPLLVVAVLILSLPLQVYPRGYSLKRAIVGGWPYGLLAAGVLCSLFVPRLRPALLAFSGVAALALVLLVPKDDWRGVVAYLNTAVSPADVVWLDPGWNDIPYRYYRPVLPPQAGDVATLAETAAAADSVWFIAERYGAAVQAPGEQWLAQNMARVQVVPFYRLELQQYRQPAP